ncbi:MAG: hypothetical protein E7208_09730 [Clostridium butyricum]|nr:hypothetical protein [Clostridium butyricum]
MICEKCGYDNDNDNTNNICTDCGHINNNKTEKGISTKKLLLLIFIPIILFTITAFAGTFIFLNHAKNKYEISKENLLSRSENINTPKDLVRDKMTTIIGDNKDVVTVMIYINGSDLENIDGCASSDIEEMLSATLSDNVNVIIQTGGSKKWHNKKISGENSQRYRIKDNELQLVDDDLGPLNMSDYSTLEDFITYCNTNYPANRNMLILWGHGVGPVYGMGYDETSPEESSNLMLNEIQLALYNANTTFDFIGFDSCSMGSLEVACALYNFSDYIIASEDTEPAFGWNYKNWLTKLSENSSISTRKLGSIIIDDYIKPSKLINTNATLSLIDLSYMKLLYNTWTSFAYSNMADLLENNYSITFSKVPDEDTSFKDTSYDDEYMYFPIVDMMTVASSKSTLEASALQTALNLSIVYSSSTNKDNQFTGLYVILPYDDYNLYVYMNYIYSLCGFDDSYIDFLSYFPDANPNNKYNFDNTSWDGWKNYKNSWDDWDNYPYLNDIAYYNWENGPYYGLIDSDEFYNTFYYYDANYSNHYIESLEKYCGTLNLFDYSKLCVNKTFGNINNTDKNYFRTTRDNADHYTIYIDIGCYEDEEELNYVASYSMIELYKTLYTVCPEKFGNKPFGIVVEGSYYDNPDLDEVMFSWYNEETLNNLDIKNLTIDNFTDTFYRLYAPYYDLNIQRD